MPCFSFLQGFAGCEAFESVKENLKTTLKRRLSFVSTCLPINDTQMVDDSTSIPTNLHQSLLQAGKQARGLRPGQHRQYRLPNGDLVLYLPPPEEVEGKIREVGDMVQVFGLQERTDLNNLEGQVEGYDKKERRYQVILEDGTRLGLKSKNLKDCDEITSPFEAWDQFHKGLKRAAEEEMKKQALKELKWHHNDITKISFFRLRVEKSSICSW